VIDRERLRGRLRFPLTSAELPFEKPPLLTFSSPANTTSSSELESETSLQPIHVSRVNGRDGWCAHIGKCLLFVKEGKSPLDLGFRPRFTGVRSGSSPASSESAEGARTGRCCWLSGQPASDDVRLCSRCMVRTLLAFLDRLPGLG
jgi:hypothetical protein